MSDRILVLEVSRLEAAHLADLTRQFVDLLDATDAAASDDPALLRLMPDAYPGDAEASAEFRRLTGGDLLARRRDEAARVIASLSPDGETSDRADLDEETGLETFVLTLDDEETGAWMRTLAALRLVLAARLGVETGGDVDPGDARFGVYEWLGYRLEGLMDAADDGT